MNPNILEQLRSDLLHGDETAKRYAAEDIEDQRLAALVPELCEGLKDASIAVAEACASALSKLGGVEAARLIAPNLATENVHLRNITSEVLGAIGLPAVEVLMEQLSSPDRDVRKFAVDSLLMIGSGAPVVGLVAALDDADVNVAATAADGIGQVGDESHVEVLSQHLNADTWMRCAVIRAMGALGGEVAFEKVLPQLETEDMLVKITTVQALGALANPRGFRHLLAELTSKNLAIFGTEVVASLHRIVVKHPSFDYASLAEEPHLAALKWVLEEASLETKLQAVEIAGHLDEAVIPYLKPAFDVDDEEMHRWVERAIGNIQPSSLKPLEEILDSRHEGLMAKTLALKAMQAGNNKNGPLVLRKCLVGQDEEKILAALSVLDARIRPIPFLELKRLIPHENPLIRIAAAQATGRLAKDEFAPHLVSRLAVEEDDEVRQAIDNALLEIGNVTENESLGVFLASFSPEERKRALSFFGFHDPETQLVKFRQGLSDSNAEIRIISFKIFANLGKADFHLVRMGLQDQVDQVRVEAVRCLRAIPEKEKVLDFVRELLQESVASHERVRVELVQILGQFRGVPGSAELLLPLLKDVSAWVQIEAVEALKALDDPLAIDPLKELLDSDNPELVEAVSAALEELE